MTAARKITQGEVSEDQLILTSGGEYVQFDGKFPRLSACSGANCPLPDDTGLASTSEAENRLDVACGAFAAGHVSEF